jgi:DNA-binding HxlR family transcriptional regulator
MTALPPTWALKVYAKLWKKFKDKKFSNIQAQQIIQNKNLNQALSRLKRDGWLRIDLDTNDSRKSVYAIKDPFTNLTEFLEELALDKDPPVI